MQPTLTFIAVVAVVAGAAGVACAAPPPLHNPVNRRLPLGSFVPAGWYATQLQLQAGGLAGLLPLFWDAVAGSAWLGGVGDTGLHEDLPYWLNGAVPLAVLVQAQRDAALAAARAVTSGSNASVCINGVDAPYGDLPHMPVAVEDAATCQAACDADAGCVAFVVDGCSSGTVTCWLKATLQPRTNATCRCLGSRAAAPHPVDIMQRVADVVDRVLARRPADGWLGPQDLRAAKNGDAYWAPMNMMRALWLLSESHGGNHTLTAAVLQHTLTAGRSMQSAFPLGEWSSSRYMDWLTTVQRLLDAGVAANNATLLQELVGIGTALHAQGVDWERFFVSFANATSQKTHGVNINQALKSAAVLYRSTGDSSLHASALSRMANLDRVYGLPTGMPCADEHLCGNGQEKMPSRGVELCAVAESMLSQAVSFEVFGDVAFIDRLERVALNALPATWASPRGGDMMMHQYLQAVNEINASISDVHVWATDGPYSETYGLEPNYPCCTANFGQAWTKLSFAGVMAAVADAGVVVAAFLPGTAALPDGTVVTVTTQYPYDDVVTVAVAPPTAATKPVYVRVPGWAPHATVAVNDRPAVPAANGTMAKVSAAGGVTTTVTLALNWHTRLESWSGSSVSVFRGPLLYAAQIQPAYAVYNTHPFNISDLQLTPVSEWRYALVVDNVSAPDASFVYHQRPLAAGEAAFNHTNQPVSLSAKARVVHGWGIRKASASAPPSSPACATAAACGPEVSLTLVPYGSTELRIAAFPLANASPTGHTNTAPRP